jgi:hypothetical protein
MTLSLKFKKKRLKNYNSKPIDLFCLNVLRYSSDTCCKASIASFWKRRSTAKSCAISFTNQKTISYSRRIFINQFRCSCKFGLLRLIFSKTAFLTTSLIAVGIASLHFSFTIRNITSRLNGVFGIKDSSPQSSVISSSSTSLSLSSSLSSSLFSQNSFAHKFTVKTPRWSW